MRVPHTLPTPVISSNTGNHNSRFFLLTLLSPSEYENTEPAPRVDQTAILVNGSIIGGLQSPPSAWTPAIVQGAQYLAALKSKNESLAFQQLAVSHAAHNTLAWIFHGTRNYAATDKALKSVLPLIGLDPSTWEVSQVERFQISKIGYQLLLPTLSAQFPDK